MYEHQDEYDKFWEEFHAEDPNANDYHDDNGWDHE